LACCGDVHPNPGPNVRWEEFESSSEDEREESGGHPVADQLAELEGANHRITVQLIMRLLHRYHTQGEAEDKPNLRDPTEAERFLREINRQLKEQKGPARTALRRRRRQAAALVAEEKSRREAERNDRDFERDKYGAYNKHMNPLSKQDCEVPKEEAEQRLKQRFEHTCPPKKKL